MSCTVTMNPKELPKTLKPGERKEYIFTITCPGEDAPIPGGDCVQIAISGTTKDHGLRSLIIESFRGHAGNLSGRVRFVNDGPDDLVLKAGDIALHGFSNADSDQPVLVFDLPVEGEGNDPGAFPPDPDERKTDDEEEGTDPKTPPELEMPAPKVSGLDQEWEVVAMRNIPRRIEVSQPIEVEIAVAPKGEIADLPETITVKGRAIMKLHDDGLRIVVVGEVFTLREGAYHGTIKIVQTGDRPAILSDVEGEICLSGEGNGVDFIIGLPRSLKKREPPAPLLRTRVRNALPWIFGSMVVTTLLTIGIAWGFGTTWSLALAWGFGTIAAALMIRHLVRNLSVNTLALLATAGVIIFFSYGMIFGPETVVEVPEEKEEEVVTEYEPIVVAPNVPIMPVPVPEPAAPPEPVPTPAPPVAAPATVVTPPPVVAAQAPASTTPAGPPATLPDTSTCTEKRFLRPEKFPEGNGKWGAVCDGDVYAVDESINDGKMWKHTKLYLLPGVKPPN